MKTLQIKQIQEQAEKLEKQHPNIHKDIEALSKLVLDEHINELELAYFVEIKNDKKRSLEDIQKFLDEITISLNEQQKIHRVNFSIRRLKDANLLRARMKISRFSSSEEKEIAKSHELAAELRQMFDLEPLKGTPRADAVKDLAGLLASYTDDNENPVDAIRESREP